MTDPEEQLRRLAEGRAAMVEPYIPDDRDEGDGADAEIIELAPRRWTAAVAATVLAIAAAGAGLFAVLAGPDGRSDPDGVALPPVTEGVDPDSIEATASTTVVPPDPSIPDVVGDEAVAAVDLLREAGLDVELGELLVPGGDDQLGKVVKVNSDGSTVELVVARLAPSLLSTDICQRPAHLLGSFDDDLLVDRVHPRFTDGRITEVEICAGSGQRVVATGLDLHRLDLAADIDRDGVDELVASVDAAGDDKRVLELVDGALVVGAMPDDVAITVSPPDPAPECLVSEPDVALWGDIDGNGSLDVASPRDGILCLSGAPVVSLGAIADQAEVWFLDDIDDDGTLEIFLGRTTADAMIVRPYAVGPDGTITPAAAEDCCVQTTPAAAARIAAEGTSDGAPELEPERDPDPDTGDDTQPDAATETDTDADPDAVSGPAPESATETARWFSCVAATAGRPAELVAGRFWIDADAGTVEWTVDLGSAASPEVVRSMRFDDPVATDAWIPGNGCRSSAMAWIAPAAIEFDDDGLATPESLAAFNHSLSEDDAGRRLVRLREALGISASFAEATGPYRESVADGFFELEGIADDSAAAFRWVFAFAEDGRSLDSVVRQQACQPGRGHAEFSTEPCT